MEAAYTASSRQHSSLKLMGTNSVLAPSNETQPETSGSVASNSAGGFDSCSFASIFSEPTDTQLMTFAQKCETSGSIAFCNGAGGSAGFGGGESCGSVASGGGFASGGSSFGGGSSFC